MIKQISTYAAAMTAFALISGSALAADDGKVVGDETIGQQRAALAKATDGAGFGPQSPRDIDKLAGLNTLTFERAPEHQRLNLCNIHFHVGAEHRGGQFTKFAGNGNGKGYGTGFLYSGELSAAELEPIDYPVGSGKGSALKPGDTIELHYVHTTAKIKPGPTLGACLSESIMNPQLRVEAQVFVLVNDVKALDFRKIAMVDKINGYWQAPNIPRDMGVPVAYAGSTTGPSYNEKGSPLQVSWSVRPNVAKVHIATLAEWLKDNEFNEDHAHAVRNLVTNPKLLSKGLQ